MKQTSEQTRLSKYLKIAMPVYHLDWRLKLFCILWLAIVIILTVLSIFWTRKKCMQRQRPKSYGASELLKTCNLGIIHILQVRHVEFKPGKASVWPKPLFWFRSDTETKPKLADTFGRYCNRYRNYIVKGESCYR